jgi:UPF0755 protein
MKRGWLLALLGAAVVGALGVLGYSYLREAALRAFAAAPFGTSERRIVLIPPGTGPHGVAQLLAQGQAVSDERLLYQLIRKQGVAPQLKAGEYEFEGALTPAQVIAKIVAGQVKVYRFTVPEGLRVDEVLPILANSELHLDLGQLTALTEDPNFLRKIGVPAQSVEGFLYPDTYQFTRGFTEASVLQKMVSRALEEYRRADLHRKPGVNLNPLQTFTLASIVEKETAAPEERPRISCVFHNRLRLGMKLQTDPTVLYAMKLLRGQFVKNITSKDLVTDHPYNTYMRTGLPPGPIANPGAEALGAALQPLDCKDLFFVSRNNGTHIFCPNLKCHNAAVDQWQRQFFRKATASHKKH